MTYGTWVIQHLMEEEGYHNEVYPDSQGNPTVGIGHLVRADEGLRLGDELDDSVIRAIFCNDLVTAEHDFYRLFGNEFRLGRIGGDARQVALVSMCWQMGLARMMGFERMRAAICEGDWTLAAREALDSQWAREDSPGRAKRVAAMLATNEYRRR